MSTPAHQPLAWTQLRRTRWFAGDEITLKHDQMLRVEMIGDRPPNQSS